MTRNFKYIEIIEVYIIFDQNLYPKCYQNLAIHRESYFTLITRGVYIVAYVYPSCMLRPLRL